MARQTLTNTATGVRFSAPTPYGGHMIEQSGELINPATGLPYLEANSQTFKAGDLVYVNAGAVTTITDDGTGTMALMGIALTDATNVTSGNIPIRVLPVNSKTIYEMNVFDDTEADTDVASVGLLVGGIYNVVLMTVTETDSSTSYCAAVDLDASTAGRVEILGIANKPQAKSTDTYIRALVRFTPYIYASGGATAWYRGLQRDI